jgi:F-type H+-transporting ATPase subunit gamma
MMSRRREIARRLEALSDIAGIMSAMKGLALMEIRMLTDFLTSQRRMVAGIEAAAAEFLADRAEFASAPTTGGELCVLVGSEQGFCGDFNESLLAHMEALQDGNDAPVRWVIIGRRLASWIGERDCVELALPGAMVADEVPATLLRLTRELSGSLADDTLAGYGLSAFYHSDALGGIRMRHLLPLRDLRVQGRPSPFPAELNLPPADFLRGLTGHYLHAVLNELLYDSLMAENRQRQAHMDRALQRLDEDRARLRLAFNARRQEEITEEIEIVLLAADMVADADTDR